MALAFHHEWAAKYDGFLIICDDMRTTGADLSRFFDLCAKHQCDWAQPALSRKSCSPYEAQYHVGGEEFRPTCFCEIGISYLSAAAFWLAVPMYARLLIGYGYGTEAALRKILRVKNGRTRFGGTVGIVDSVVVTHPHHPRDSSHLYKFGDPNTELADTLNRYQATHTVNMYEP